MTRFVILSAPRSGSNLLCSLLNSHPEVLCHHEVFNPGGIYFALDHRDGSIELGTIQDRDQQPLQFLEGLWSASLGHQHVGFKMTRGQSQTVLTHVLNDWGVRKIVLRRRNRIKTYISTVVAEQSGQWEVYSETELVGPKPMVHVELPGLHRHIAENEAYYAEIDQAIQGSRQAALAVAYEDLASPAEHSRLLAYLGVVGPSVPLTARSVKQNPTDLRRLVANYDELHRALRGTDMLAELCSIQD